MNRFLFPVIVSLLAMVFAAAVEKNPQLITELTRPNSGTFSFEQAEARKSEILSNKATKELSDWKNPYMGFSIHIHKDEGVTVYSHLLGAFKPYNEPLTKRTVDQIKKMADELPLLGNPAGILITSDRPLKESKIVHQILDALFIPSVQLFYATNREKGGAHQPAAASESKVE